MRRPVSPHDDAKALDHYARIISTHATALVDRSGYMRGCTCEFCKAATRKIEEIRARARGRQRA
jgi:hypothetical protein